jgi:hypothetical protein
MDCLGILHIPPLWKDFDQKHSEFTADSRNIRLAFASYGLNSYRTMNVSYSIWPGMILFSLMNNFE